MATETIALPPTAEDGGHALLVWLRQMRDEHPVWPDKYGMWHVFRYADVERVTADHSCSPPTPAGWSRRCGRSPRAC